VNPAEFSLRELGRMAEGKKSHDWDLFAPLICYIANPWMPKRRKLELQDVHPFRQKKKMTEEQFVSWLYGNKKKNK
jgi:hypothetical protein